eukprot:2710388-Prymnesium_polylepis.3
MRKSKSPSPSESAPDSVSLPPSSRTNAGLRRLLSVSARDATRWQPEASSANGWLMHATWHFAKPLPRSVTAAPTRCGIVCSNASSIAARTLGNDLANGTMFCASLSKGTGRATPL